MSDHYTKYNARWASPEPVSIELKCIERGGQWKDGNGVVCGNGLAFHVKEFAKRVWPWFYWHRWGEMQLREYCEGGRIATWGAASSQKTSMASLFGLTMYWAKPRGTTVLVATTTREMLQMRIWGEIKMLWRKGRERYPWLPGHITDSSQMISTDGKDVEGREFRDGIVGRPVKKGGEWVGLGDFVGIKNDVMIVIGDEYHLMPDAVGRSIANLGVNENCTFITLGNLNDLNTPLGQEAEPELGWDALPDSDKARVYKTRWARGRAIQLPGVDSPNLDWPEGAEPFKKLIGRRFLRECEQNYGKDTPLYNMFAAGRVPRSTMENRVITKQVCLKFNAFEPVTWGHEPVTKLYCADISYTAEHGDRTAGRPCAFGKDVDGAWRFAPLERPRIYRPSDRAAGTIEEQIAVEMRGEGERLGIPPEHVFFDGTGRSSFTSAIMRVWSTKVNAIEFGGSATPRPNFIGRHYMDDLGGKKRRGELLPCNEVFGKFVTELWFAFRYVVEADQFRGLDEETAKEFYLRLWRLMPANKMDVESKPDMKLRLGRSPDLADCLVTGIEGARRLGFPLGVLNKTPGKRSGWLSKVAREYSEAARKQELAYN